MSSQKSCATPMQKRLLRQLINIFAVVFVISLILGFILPSYSDYIGRTKVAEGLVVASGIKSAITEYYMKTGEWPQGSQDEKQALLGVNIPANLSRYVQELNILSAGMIEIVYTDDIFWGGGSRRIILMPQYIGAKQSILWHCLSPYENGFKSLRNIPAECRHL